MSRIPVALESTVVGQGRPALVAHGLFGSGANWRTIARRLGSRLECHLVDQRNHGRSPHARGMAYPDLAADVLAYLDTHRIDRAGLIGHSMGGKTAMTLALTAPARVRWLIVADIAPARSPSDHGPIADALRALPVESLASRSGADAALASAVPDPGLRRFLLQNLVAGETGFRWRIDLDAIADALPDLADFPAIAPGAVYEGPVLFLRGARSDYIAARDEPRIRALFPAARIATVDDAGHWLHTEQPAAVMAHIEAFLDGAPSSSEAAASDRQGMLGASSRRKPPGDAIPVAASDLHSGNHFRKLGSSARIDTAQGFESGPLTPIVRTAIDSEG